MSFFLADSKGGFSPAWLSGASSPTRTDASSSTTTTTTSTPTTPPSTSSSSSSTTSPLTSHTTPTWAGWDVLYGPADLWASGDGKAVRQPGALSQMLPMDDDEEEGVTSCSSSLAERHPRAGQVKRKRAEFEGEAEPVTDHEGVRGILALVRPGADNLRALMHVLALDVADDLTPGEARDIGRALGRQLGAGDTTPADRDEVLAGMMRAALSRPARSAALCAMASQLGEALRGSGQRIAFSYVDALFTQAAELSLAPLADQGGLVPGAPDASGRLGPLKVLLGVLRAPQMSAAYLAWFRSSVAAWVAPPLAGDAQDCTLAQRTQPVRLLGALARAFLADGDTEVGQALAVDFLDALGACDGLETQAGCELLAEGLGGSPGEALGLLMTLTPRLQADPANRLAEWVASGQLWTVDGTEAS